MTYHHNNLDTSCKMSSIVVSTCTIFMFILLSMIMYGKGVVLDCYNKTIWAYDGHQQTTVSGTPCLRWDYVSSYSAGNFPDATVSDAANFCRNPDGHDKLWCYITKSFVNNWNECGINKCGDGGLSECGKLSIKQPTILGRNITFSFTPDVYDSNAILEWQRTKGRESWTTLPFKYNFTQFQITMTYYLKLMDSDKNDEVFYRVHYYNETTHCWMKTGKLELVDIRYKCGLVYLRTDKVVKNGTVEIEYYPSKYVMKYSSSFTRTWVHSYGQKTTSLNLNEDRYEETLEQNYKFVLTIFKFYVSMNGVYGVSCGGKHYTNFITVEIPEPPSIPVVVGLQDIENCKDCIIGEIKEMFEIACQIDRGTRPFTVTMTIGKESYTPQEFNSTTYMVFLVLKDYHHMQNVTFSVVNKALTTPLNATAKVFVIRPPTFQFSVPESIREGEAVNISCTVNGGRPYPNVYFNISGSEISSSNLHQYNDSTTLNTNAITLTTFKREWNKQHIRCCRYNVWYKVARECSAPKQVNYLFPPSNVMLELNIDGIGRREAFAICTVYGSNPACGVQFRAQSGIIGSERDSRNLSQPHGAWNSVYEMYLNVDEEDNGKNVTCVVECEEFSVNLTDTVSIRLPYPPVIVFNITGSILNVQKGKRAQVGCLADSIPASNISWIEELSNGNITKKQCGLAQNCLLTIDTDKVGTRKFMCQIQYRTKVDHRYLTVHVAEKADDYNDKQKIIDQDLNKSIIWIILGACLLVVGIILIAVLIIVIRKKLQNSTEKTKCRVDYHKNADCTGITNPNPDDSVSGNQHQKSHVIENEADILVYSQPIKKKTTENKDNTYAQVNKVRNSACSSKEEKPTQAESGQLLYADLAFDPNDTPLQGAVAMRPDSPTEYADIDHVMTNAHTDNNDTSAEPENIYANQYSSLTVIK